MHQIKRQYLLKPDRVRAFKADTQRYSDYYPYGMLLPERNGNSGEYRFSFQGQEADPEIKGEGNSINYKYRMHDPRVGRFFAVDPLFKDYPYYTPYSFSGNKLIHAVELEGLEEAIIIENKRGDGKHFLISRQAIQLNDRGVFYPLVRIQFHHLS